MDICFAKSRYEYKSYTDYWKLVELSEFETCYVDEIDVTRECVYVVTPVTGEYRPWRDGQREKDHNCRLVWWSLERPGAAQGMAAFRHGVVKSLLDEWYFDEIWISDKFLVEQMHDSRVRFVVLGSHTNLGTYERGVIEWDFAHMGYVNPRRGRILSSMDVKMAPNGWGDVRMHTLMRTKFMLNIHQDDWPLVEPLRFALAAAFALPILTETIRDAYPYSRGGDDHYIVQATAEELPGKALNMLQEDYAQWRATGLRLYSALTGEFGFEKMVRKAVHDMPDSATVEIV